jgi:Family of unknown function (DUF6088)
MARSTADAVRRYIGRLDPGAVFTPAELLRARLGSSGAVREALRRLTADGAIRRVSKGYYDIPRADPRIGPLSPTPEAIVAAHARKTGGTIERPEADAANKLGLTTQVTARAVYRTNLFPRELHIAGHHIRLRTVGPRTLARGDDPAELVVDALSAIGRENIAEKDIAALRRFVHEHHLEHKLRRRSKRAPSWMLPYLDVILDRNAAYG